MIAAGFAAFTSYIAYGKFSEAIDAARNPSDVTKPGTLFWLRLAFGRTRSRMMGSLMEQEIPIQLRTPLYKAFAWMYGANIAEVQYPLESYKTFQEFFSRSLLPGSRVIQSTKSDNLVSPCDGEVLTVGDMSAANPRIPQVKGTTYNLKSFIGTDPFKSRAEGNIIRYCVIYLAPGDYHRFHSPTDFEVTQGRHFTGEVLPVNKILVGWFDDLFALNERVVLSGKWSLGQLHYGIVGAYNVGKIDLCFDDKLQTNELKAMPCYRGGEVRSKQFKEAFSHGDLLGSFKLGSTIVLVFESSPAAKWLINPGDKVKMGQKIFENTF
jgi:phosphatidylserine decarboxylase